jgi:hypothetical protein
MRLCYVKNRVAYFAGLAPDEVWGDDWNDAPYEHNAGRPYHYVWRDGKRVLIEIVEIAFEGGGFETPAERAMYGNSGYSVQDINAGAAAWLFGGHPKPTAIYAGATIEEFRAKLESGGGRIVPADARPGGAWEDGER